MQAFSRSGSSLVCLLLVAVPVAAGTLQVNSSAKFTGSFGLEATIEPACAGTNELTVDSPTTVSGTFEACSRLVAKDVKVTGTTSFSAGLSVVIEDNFSVASGATLSVGTDSSLSPLAFVRDESPAALGQYAASFKLRANDLTMADGDQPAHLRGFAADGANLFELALKRNVALGENRLVLSARNDDGMVKTTAARFPGDVEPPHSTERVLPPEWNTVTVDWGVGDGNGWFRVSLDGSVFSGLIDLDNDMARLEAVEWGIVGGEFPGTTGKLQVDDFRARVPLSAADPACNPSGGSGGLSPGKHDVMIAGHPAEIVVGDGYDPATPTFLAIKLHGDGGLYQFIGVIEDFVNEKDWVYVAPQAPAASAGYYPWIGSGSAADVDAALDHVSAVIEHMYANYNVCRNWLFGGSVSGGSYFYDGYFFARRGDKYPAFWNLCCGASQLGQPPFFSQEQSLIEQLGQNPDIVKRSEFKYTIGDQDFLFDEALTSEPVYENAGFKVIKDHLAGVGHCEFDTPKSIMDYWKSRQELEIFADGFESGDVSAWSSSAP